MFHQWRLKDFAPGEGIALQVFGEQVDTADWLAITVPGDVHQTLVAYGRIEDPFYDRNEDRCRWIEEREWWYRVDFEVDEQNIQEDERMLLSFQGLDTFVTLWLNGERLGQHENMFRAISFDVTRRVRCSGFNTLVLCFHPPLQAAPKAPFESWGRNTERVTMRKAQFGYGWDWGPRLPTVGIWRPVELRRQRIATIEHVYFSTIDIEKDQKKALVEVQVDVDVFSGEHSPQLSVALYAPGDAGEVAEGEAVARQQVAVEEGRGTHKTTIYMEVERPRLWWTHDLGEPALYTLHVQLLHGEDELTHSQQEVGIRTLKLDQALDPDEPGARYFRFVLNGMVIFARGANWIPASSFIGILSGGQEYEKLLRAAQRANMNMLRVWGGGIYEHDIFYTLCSQLGLLVWQDFMFACAMYPENDEHFVHEVEAEAAYQVQRLRGYACMALWCGNNENQWIHDRTHWSEPGNRVPGALYYDEILPRAVETYDGKTPYWPGSPYGGDDYNGEQDGDVHNWQVWHGNIPRRFGEEARVDQTPQGVAYGHYTEDKGRFISEFGMHASPVYETLQRVVPEDQLYFHSPSMDHHNKDNPKNKGDNLMLTVTGLPEDLQDYIDFSMIAQAEGLKFGIEHYRRRKPHCSGTFIWQLNDCWPVLSWSILDYYGFGKASYYYTCRVYAPVLASFRSLGDEGYELWVTNDTLSVVRDEMHVALRTFDGTSIWEKQLSIAVGANGSECVEHWDVGSITTRADAYLAVRSANDVFPMNRHFLVAIKDLQREIVAPEVTMDAENDHALRVHVHAVSYTYFLHFIVADEHTHFSDNYFDLEAGETRDIIISHEQMRITPAMVTVGWR